MEEIKQRNMRDLGFSNEWHADSLEQRLVEMTRHAGYHFERVEIGGYETYICKEAGLMYHV